MNGRYMTHEENQNSHGHDRNQDEQITVAKERVEQTTKSGSTVKSGVTVCTVRTK
jgi:hypothetical protein